MGPKLQTLLFVLESECDDRLVNELSKMIETLAVEREWTVEPPVVVDVNDNLKSLGPGDRPFKSMGGVLQLFARSPPLPRETEVRLLEDVTVLVQALCRFSLRHHADVELELDGDDVESISEGKMDDSLAVGLLGEWRRNLGLS